jgi:hypothetical protein
MNIRRGFRRITFVLSILVACTAAAFCSASFSDYLNSERGAYNNSKNSYENINQFWLVWDANEWIGGNREAVRNLLNLQTNDRGYQYELREGKFTFDNGKVVTLHASEVLPGINKDMLYVPLDVLEKAAQSAKEQSIEKAKRRLKDHEYWWTKSTITFVLVCMVAALVGAALGFLATWIASTSIYRFIEWLILGFRDDTRDKIEKEEPSQ